MRLKTVDVVCGLLLAVPSIVAGGCTFTHSLNDLQGGIADASGGAADIQPDQDDGHDGNRPNADTGLVYPPHTIDLTTDGNHFFASETFPTSNFAYTAYVAWDRDTFYFAVEGAYVESNDPATWILAYWGTAASSGTGTRTGQTYGNQTPTLNFEANYHVRWKGDDSLISLMRYSPGGWQDGGAFPGRHQRKGRFVEFSVPLKAIVAPGETATRARFVMALIHGVAPETTYASVPSTALVSDDAFNPSYAHSFDFDLTGGTLPNQHLAQ
jgi:hypothetical protein